MSATKRKRSASVVDDVKDADDEKTEEASTTDDVTLLGNGDGGHGVSSVVVLFDTADKQRRPASRPPLALFATYEQRIALDEHGGSASGTDWLWGDDDQ